MRRLTTRGGGPSRALDDLVQAVVVAELLAPSSRIWVLSPWISDIPVLNNEGGEFQALLPTSPKRRLSLTEVLGELASLGSSVRVVVRDVPHNIPVVQRLGSARKQGADICVHQTERLHDKGLLTDRVYLEGSMNFTHFGRTVNEEGISVTRDRDLIARMRMDFESRFADE